VPQPCGTYRATSHRSTSIVALFSKPCAWATLAALLALALFLSTLQWDINGSPSPYATDVGELQNALPRWGTIHFTGYPVYMMTGSALVTSLRWLGVSPAAGASLLSALWGALAIALLALLGMALGAPGELALPCALLAAVSTATLVDASLAEIHSMTMALTAASLLLAIRFGQSGKRRDLFWLVLVYTQGLAHQRAMLFMAPGLLILCGHRWRVAWRNALPAIGLALLAPLAYLYLPLREWMGADWTFGQTGTWHGFSLREWMGADWTFGQTGTWHGFWAMFLDTKAERIIAVPSSLSELAARLRTTAELLHEDLPLPLIALGLLGTLAPWARPTSPRVRHSYHRAGLPSAMPRHLGGPRIGCTAGRQASGHPSRMCGNRPPAGERERGAQDATPCVGSRPRGRIHLAYPITPGNGAGDHP